MTPQNDAPWWDPDARATEETPQPTASPAPESQPENGSAPRRMSLRKTICDWISANRHTALYMLIGLVVAIGILCFGFWRTLLVALCVGTGYTLGSWRDGNPRLLARIRRFYERWIDDNPFMK